MHLVLDLILEPHDDRAYCKANINSEPHGTVQLTGTDLKKARLFIQALIRAIEKKGDEGKVV